MPRRAVHCGCIRPAVAFGRAVGTVGTVNEHACVRSAEVPRNAMGKVNKKELVKLFTS